MSNLLIEIGIAALKAAWSDGPVLGKIFRYQGEMVIDFILSLTEKQKPEVMAVISSSPLEVGEEGVLRGECEHLLLLNSSDPEILQRNGLPEYLSYDRAAAIIAAKYLFKDKDCTVFDFGTTLKVDFIDRAGFYKGGNISPGCRTRFKSLNRYSRTLPLLDTPVSTQPEGTSLTSSMEAGVISGIMFEIEGYVRMHPNNIIVFTGGDAIYFAKRMKNSIFVVCNLVMTGLALITDNYVRKKLQ